MSVSAATMRTASMLTNSAYQALIEGSEPFDNEPDSAGTAYVPPLFCANFSPEPFPTALERMFVLGARLSETKLEIRRVGLKAQNNGHNRYGLRGGLQ